MSIFKLTELTDVFSKHQFMWFGAKTIWQTLRAFQRKKLIIKKKGRKILTKEILKGNLENKDFYMKSRKKKKTL